MKNRKTYFRKDIGRVELEGGWFPGESWAIEAHAGFSPSDQRLCLVYLQVAKLCFSITVDTGRRVSLEDAADWGEKLEALAHRELKPAAPKSGAVKWYIVKGEEDRGPGRVVSPGECGTDNQPGFAGGKVLLMHPSWTHGHSGSFRAGGIGYPGHCFFYPPIDLREVPAPTPTTPEAAE